MKVKRFLKEYFYSDFFRHFLMVTNFLVFFLISFISLTLDTISPFNYINVALAGIFAVVTILYLIVKKQKPAVSVFIMCYLIIVLCFLISFAVHGFTSFPKTPILVTLLSIFVFLWMDQNKKYFSLYLLAFLLIVVQVISQWQLAFFVLFFIN